MPGGAEQNSVHNWFMVGILGMSNGTMLITFFLLGMPVGAGQYCVHNQFLLDILDSTLFITGLCSRQTGQYRVITNFYEVCQVERDSIHNQLLLGMFGGTVLITGFS